MQHLQLSDMFVKDGEQSHLLGCHVLLITSALEVSSKAEVNKSARRHNTNGLMKSRTAYGCCSLSLPSAPAL